MPAIFVITIIFILPRCSTGWFIRDLWKYERRLEMIWNHLICSNLIFRQILYNCYLNTFPS